MRPICTACSREMTPQGSTVTLAYLHNNAPVDYSRGMKYACEDCSYAVILPVGYSFGMAGPTGIPDAIPVQPPVAREQKRKPLP